MPERLPIAQETGDEDSNVPRARTLYCGGSEKAFLSTLGTRPPWLSDRRDRLTTRVSRLVRSHGSTGALTHLQLRSRSRTALRHPA